MTRKSQLQRSGNRLQEQGALWLQQTRMAGDTFLDESRAAGEAFVEDLTSAGRKLADSVGRSTDELRKAVRKEALDWQKLVLKTRDAYLEALKDRVQGLEQQAQSTREALTPEAVESTVLESTRDMLVKAQATVDERLEKASKPKKSTGKSKTARKPKARKAAGKQTADKEVEAPIQNYDKLTAKDVVSRVQRLSGPQATAVLDYERARKKRATVIRAVEKRLAAAS
jgi:hypothetical protein